MKADWFESWFDSPYYPLLYDHRNDAEAEAFIRFLAEHIPIQAHEHWVDLACGRGRHAKFLQQFCQSVTGIDLSTESIKDAQLVAHEYLHFYVADMRTFTLSQLVDGFLNLFTSLGYFQNTLDNLKVLKQIHSYLKPQGILLIDFLNAPKVKRELISFQEITKNNIHFKVHKKISEGKVLKTIEIQDQEKNYIFEESVQLIELQDFKNMFQETGFIIQNIWGDYLGGSYTEDSPRLIIQVQKK